MASSGEPADPFIRTGAPDPLGEGQLLWEQLMAIRKWHDFARAINALSPADLRHIVFLKVYEAYLERQEERVREG